MTPLLEIEELVVDFATPAGRVRTVNGVSYEVAAGEIRRRSGGIRL